MLTFWKAAYVARCVLKRFCDEVLIGWTILRTIAAHYDANLLAGEPDSTRWRRPPTSPALIRLQR